MIYTDILLLTVAALVSVPSLTSEEPWLMIRLSIMVPVCARPVSPVTMLPEPSSRKSRDQQELRTKLTFRSIVGRPRHQGVMVGMGQKDSYVGYVL